MDINRWIQLLLKIFQTENRPVDPNFSNSVTQRDSQLENFFHLFNEIWYYTIWLLSTFVMSECDIFIIVMPLRNSFHEHLFDISLFLPELESSTMMVVLVPPSQAHSMVSDPACFSTVHCGALKEFWNVFLLSGLIVDHHYNFSLNFNSERWSRSVLRSTRLRMGMK